MHRALGLLKDDLENNALHWMERILRWKFFGAARLFFLVFLKYWVNNLFFVQ